MNARLLQYQCQREGMLFYYQHVYPNSHLIARCPLCGSKRIKPTGRTFDAVDENHPLTTASAASSESGERYVVKLDDRYFAENCDGLIDTTAAQRQAAIFTERATADEAQNLCANVPRSDGLRSDRIRIVRLRKTDPMVAIVEWALAWRMLEREAPPQKDAVAMLVRFINAQGEHLSESWRQGLIEAFGLEVINAQGEHLSESWRQGLIEAFGLEVVQMPYRPVRQHGLATKAAEALEHLRTAIDKAAP